MSDKDAPADQDPPNAPAVADDNEIARDVPDWDDEYLDRVSDRLLSSYDLEKDHRVQGRTYPMYGRMLVKNQKQFFVAALRYGYHEVTEHLLVDRTPDLAVADLETDVELAHDLADDWITLDDDHFETGFTFVHVVDELTDDVADYVAEFSDRTLLKYGFYGHYEIHFVVVAPEQEAIVASEDADVWRAFRLWDSVDAEPSGLLASVKRLVK
jgi:hypothetical protein